MTTPTINLTDQQKRDMRSWCRQINLPGDATITALFRKYGSLAYDIVKQSMEQPSAVKRRLNKTVPGSANDPMSKRLIQYFINTDDLSYAEIATTLQKTEREVTQAIPAARRQTMDQHIQERQMQQRSPNCNSMTLNDYLNNYPANQRPQAGQTLINSAWTVYGNSEGIRKNPYTDSANNPTIGNGYLIFDYSKRNNATYMRARRKAFQELDLIKNGRRLNATQKGAIFDSIAAEVKRNGTIANGAAYCEISEAGMKKIFAEKFTEHYKQAKAVFPNIDKFPLDLQLALSHAYYAGMGLKFNDALKGTNSYHAGYYSRDQWNAMAQFRENKINKNDPRDVQRMLQTMVEINRPSLADEFKRETREICQTLAATETRWAAAQPRHRYAQNLYQTLQSGGRV